MKTTRRSLRRHSRRRVCRSSHIKQPLIHRFTHRTKRNSSSQGRNRKLWAHSQAARQIHTSSNIVCWMRNKTCCETRLLTLISRCAMSLLSLAKSNKINNFTHNRKPTCKFNLNALNATWNKSQRARSPKRSMCNGYQSSKINSSSSNGC